MGKAKRAVAVAVRENVWEPLKLGLISGYIWCDTTHFVSEDDYHTGFWSVIHCYQQSYSGLLSPGRSCSTYLWNDSWVPAFHMLILSVKEPPNLLCLLSFHLKITDNVSGSYYILVYLLWSLTEQYTTSGHPSFLRAMRSERKGKIIQTNGKKGGATVVSHRNHRSPLDRALVSCACIQPCLKIKIRDYLQSNCTDTCHSATCAVINVRKCRRYRPFALN